MKFSLMTEPQLGGTYDEILAAARFAEAEGLVSFARSDHIYWQGSPLPATDAFATLAGLARDTQTIRLAVLVTPITFRHPAVIAKNAATIDQMSDGRLDLGIGTGWNDFEHDSFGLVFPEWHERRDRLEEAVAYLEAAFGPGTGSFNGKYYRLDATVEPKPKGLRLILGGTGPRRTPAFAGRRADEYNMIMTSPAVAAQRIETMRAASNGRKVEATMMGQAFVGRTDAEYHEIRDLQAARRDVRGEELEIMWLESGQLFGTSDQVADQIAALEEVGVERLYLQWLDLSDFDGLARMVDAVRRR